MRKVAIIEGDGIGPEVIRSAVDVLRYISADLEMVSADMGQGSYRRNGSYLPQGTIDLLKESDAALFGAITSPTTYDPSYRSPLLQLRREFDLYANVRPVKRLHPSIGLVELDVLIVRENTGDVHGSEREVPGGVITERKVSERACRRIVDKAIELCRAEDGEHHLRP